MNTRTWAWRLAAAGVAAILIPACNPTQTSAVLFMDQFNGAFPGGGWTTSGTGVAAEDLLKGFPDPPSLRMSGTGGQSVAATTTTTFNAKSMTFAVHMAAKTGGAGDVGVGTMTILDNSAAAVAFASWDVASGGILTLNINGTAVPVAAPDALLAFHRLAFTMTSGGKASWSLDNGTAPVTVTGFFPSLPLTLKLDASYPPAGTGFALFYFDNVDVTSP